MQRLNDMSTSELVTLARNYASSISEIGIYSELVKELTTRLSLNTAAVNQALKERDEARMELSSAQLTISQITKVMGTSNTLSISEQVSALNQQVVSLTVENAGLKSAIEFATAPDMWVEDADGMYDYKYCEWYGDVLKEAMTTKSTDSALANIKAQVWLEAKDLAKSMLAADSVDHLDFLFDGKVQQLRKGAADEQ